MIVAIFANETGGVSIVNPVEKNPREDLLSVFKKAVPKGVAFWVIDASELPADRTYRDAWELDIATLPVADGYGEADD